MKDWIGQVLGLCALVPLLSCGATKRNPVHNDVHDDDTQAGGAGGAAQVSAAGARTTPEGGAGGVRDALVECGAAGDAPTVKQPVVIGVLDAAQAAMSADGIVTSIDGNQVSIATDDGEVVFAWIDDSVGDYVEAGEALTIDSRRSLGQFTLTSLSSRRVMLATLDGQIYTVLATSADSEREIALPSLPVLRYGLRDCCGESSSMFVCDYSLLTAAVDDEQVEIPLGQVETVGGWSVGNWGSSFHVYGEQTWAVRATFVGPPQL